MAPHQARAIGADAALKRQRTTSKSGRVGGASANDIRKQRLSVLDRMTECTDCTTTGGRDNNRR